MIYSIFGWLNDFALAWSLMTVIPFPIPFNRSQANRPTGLASAYYPLVGLILGLILAGTGWFLFWLLPTNLAAALLLTFWAGLTGLLHLDGLMDSCDGLLPPRDPARRLEIMKDSRVGAFGVVGAVLLLLLKFNALAALPAAVRLPALVVVPMLARWGATWAMVRYPSARRDGAGVFFSAGLGWRQIIIASVIAIPAALLLMGWPSMLLIGLVWLTMTLLARLAMARIAGLTGDVYGAICEITETLGLIAIVVARGWI